MLLIMLLALTCSKSTFIKHNYTLLKQTNKHKNVNFIVAQKITHNFRSSKKLSVAA